MDSNPYEFQPLSDGPQSDAQIRPPSPVRSLTCLTGYFLIVGSGTLANPHHVFPGGLNGFDYLLMLVLPFGAYRAGREWYNGPIFLAYGAIGLLPFVHGHLLNVNLQRSFLYGQATVVSELTAWSLTFLLVTITCRTIGKAAYRGRTNGAESDATSQT